jgi:hypothetical protein
MFTDSLCQRVCFVFRALILLGVGLMCWGAPGVARGQIFVSEQGVYPYGILGGGLPPGGITPNEIIILGSYSKVGEYDALTGAVIKETLVSTSGNPGRLAVSGSNLYVSTSNPYEFPPLSALSVFSTSGSASATFSPLPAYAGNLALSGSDIFIVPRPGPPIGPGNIAEYDAETGAPINTSLDSIILGIPAPSLAASATDVFVSISSPGIVIVEGTSYVTVPSAITQYPITGGTGVSISSVGTVNDMTVSGNSLYICGSITAPNSPAGTTGTAGVGEYDATTGAAINPLLIGGLNSPVAMAVSGGDLYVADSGNETVGVYDAVTGAVINTSLISGLDDVQGVAVIPETSTAAPGKYTVLLTSLDTSGDVPQGSGYATLTIGPKYGVIFAGRLPDGEAFSMTGSVTGTSPYQMSVDKALSYPFVSSGTGESLLSGTLVFANVAGGCDLSGKIAWMKRAQTRGEWRPSIDTVLNAIGSRYTPPGRTGSLLPDFVGGTLELSDTGTLNTSGTGTISKNVILTVNNTVLVVDPGASKLEVRTNPASGVFTGTFLYPVPGKKPVLTEFGGVFFQDQRMGGGFFLGPGGSGTVNLTGP